MDPKSYDVDRTSPIQTSEEVATRDMKNVEVGFVAEHEEPIPTPLSEEVQTGFSAPPSKLVGRGRQDSSFT